MAEPQPPTIVEGATSGDVEDELPTAKSAEDRKAAAALSKLDDARDSESTNAAIDQDAVSKAMKNLGGEKTGAAAVSKKVKVDAADVALLMDELDMTKPKATDLLKAHDGDAVEAMRAFIAVK